MSIDKRLSRRSFLGTSAKVGAGLALAGAGLDLTSTKTEAAGGITLNYMGLGNNAAPFAHGQQETLAQYTAVHPNVTFNYTPAPSQSATAYHDKLVTVLSAHDGSIDIFDSDVIWQAQWAPAGWALPLDVVFPPSQWKNYTPGNIQADTVGGHIYAIPWMFDCGHLFYRKDILDANGLKPAQTWEDLHDQGVMLAKKYPKMVPFAACYNPGQQLICNFMEYSWSAGGDFLDPKTGAVIFNSPANLQSLEMMISYIKGKVVQPSIISGDLSVGLSLFTTGNAIYHRNWNYAYIQSQANPALVGKIGVADPPHFKGGSSYSCTGGWQYVINPFSNNIKAVTDLALFLSTEKMEVFKTLHTSWNPAYIAANTDPAIISKYPSFPLLIKQARIEKSRPKTPFWTAMSTIAEAELVNGMIGKKTPQQALKDAQGKIESILAGA